MNEQYLSENIIIRDGKTYYEDKLIKKHNWHIKLEELGWQKLHRNWITKLNKLHNPYPNNSLFGSLECGDDGDCLFHCIASSLNSKNEDYYDSKDIRKLVANSITQEQFDNIITCYRCMKDLNDFDESWDPYKIENLEQFKDKLMESGHNYWCDYLVLQLVCQAFNVNIFVLSQNEWTNTYDKYPLAFKYDTSKGSILVLHENESHFKLIGHFKDIINTYFTNDTLPFEIKRLYDIS
jgi:hypothetical protein